jgi:hypothetical protein
MAVTTHSANAAPTALTLSVESVLATITVAGVHDLHLDTNALTGAEVLEARVYEAVDGTTLRLLDAVTITPGGSVAARSLAYATDGTMDLRFAIIQTGGTGRVIPWRILTIG